MKRILAISVVAALATPLGVSQASDEGNPISFEVVNLHTQSSATIHGTIYEPECEATGVVVLQHGLSYTRGAWNFEGYSVVEPILDAGFAVVIIDRLGYAESVLENGYNVSSEAHASNASQIVAQLRDDFDQVALGGHSAGAEASLLATGLASLPGSTLAKPDAVLGLGYHHFPSPQIVQDFFTGDYIRAAQDDYEYFLGTPEHRAWMFFTGEADPQVVAADADAAVLTPSGEVFSIGKQPSRYVVAAIDVPVFLQFGDSDRLFEADFIDEEAALFVSAPSLAVDVVEGSGHTFMLHPEGIAGSQRLAQWLKTGSGLASCLPTD